MSSEQPLLQVGTPLRDNDPGYVILRLDDNVDVETALAIINDVNARLAPLMVGLANTVSRLLQDGTAGVTGQLQAAGLNPVPVTYPEVTSTYTPPPAAPQPVYQPQAQASQAYAPPVQQQQSMAQQPVPKEFLMSGPCWASTRHVADCKDCGGPTFLKTMAVRGNKKLNAHQCAAPNSPCKVTWCETPIWNSRKAAAMGKGLQVPEGLIYG